MSNDGCVATVHGDGFIADRFSARLELSEPRHGDQLPYDIVGDTWTKLQP